MDIVSSKSSKVTIQPCRNGDGCVFLPYCLFRHPNSHQNDQHTALLRNVKDVNGDRSVVSLERSKIVRNLVKQEGPYLDNNKSREEELIRKEEDMEIKKVSVVTCNRGEGCVFKPKCKFNHPEGGNLIPTELKKSGTSIDKNLKHLNVNEESGPVAMVESNTEKVQVENICKHGADCKYKPRCKFSHPEGGNDPSQHVRKNLVQKKSWTKKKIGGKECKHGIKCKRKPLCLFVHPKGGNDHETAQKNFSVDKDNDSLKLKAVEKIKEVEKKFKCDGGSEYSDMLAWCEVAKKVNEEALEDVNPWKLEMFYDEQVNLLGGSQELYEEVDKSLRDLVFVPEIGDLQRKLYNWRTDFFLDKFKSTYLGDDISTWITDGFDDNHFIDTIPFQITRNFDAVMNLAATNRIFDCEEDRYYFSHNENVSFMADTNFSDMVDEDNLSRNV